MIECDGKKPVQWRARQVLVSLILCAGIGSVAQGADYYNGRDIYQKHCLTCHGAGGRSQDAGIPDFSRGDALFASDTDLFDLIRKGSAAMPAYRSILEDEEIRDVIAFLRSLQR